MKQLALAFLCVAALIFTVGSVGAWDNGNIGGLQGLIQVAIGIAVEWFALKKIDM